MKQMLFSLLILSTFFASCSADKKTTKLSFNGGELLYTDLVTEAQAKDLGNYLVKEGFYDGRKKTTQLDKQGNVFHFAMILNDTLINSAEYTAMGQLSCDELSQKVFHGSPVEVDFCDDQMNVKKNLKAIPAKPLTENTQENIMDKIWGTWMCSNITGGEQSNPEKDKADLAILTTNFTFAFNDDNTFMSDFINNQDVSHPMDVQGTYKFLSNKIVLEHLKINGKPEAQHMVFDIDFKGGQLILTSKEAGKNDLVMSFKKTSVDN